MKLSDTLEEESTKNTEESKTNNPQPKETSSENEIKKEDNQPTPENRETSSITPAEKPQESNKRGLFSKILISFLVIILLLFIAVSTAAAAIAYDKFDIGNEELEEKIKMAVMSIPFTPKTPEYVLKKSILAHADVSSGYMDISLASNSENSLGNMLGTGKLDIALKGSLDLTEVENPKADMNIIFGREIDVDLRALNQKGYFRLNKYPSVLTIFIGENPELENIITNRWVSYDLSEVDTEARDSLNEQTEEDTFDKAYTDLLENVFNDKILPVTKISSEDLDGESKHKLTVNLDEDLIDEIQKEIVRNSDNTLLDPYSSREILTNADINIWIDKNTYHMNKTQINFSFNIDSNLPAKVAEGINNRPENLAEINQNTNVLAESTESVDAVLIFKLSNIGEEVDVSPPSSSTPFENWANEIVTALTGGSGMLGMNPEARLESTEDARRQQDLMTVRDAINVSLVDGEIELMGNSQMLARGTSKLYGNEITDNGSGWVKVRTVPGKRGLSSSLAVLPDDPKGKDAPCDGYFFASNGQDYEIRTCFVTEEYKELYTQDGGDDPNYYEVGTDLTIL